jgi:hypothetical protein
MPGFNSAPGFGTRASTTNDRDSAEICGFTAQHDLACLDARDGQLKPQWIDFEERDDCGGGLHVLSERDFPLADEPIEGRRNHHVGDSLLGERELGTRLGQRRARRVDVLCRGLGLGARLVGDRPGNVSGRQQRRVSLRRGLGQGVLRFGELDTRFGPGDRGHGFVEPQPGVHTLQPDQHGPLADVLSDVHRRGDDAARRLGRDVRGFVRLEAPRGLDRHGLVNPLHLRHGDRHHGPGLCLRRRGLPPAAAGTEERGEAAHEPRGCHRFHESPLTQDALSKTP